MLVLAAIVQIGHRPSLLLDHLDLAEGLEGIEVLLTVHVCAVFAATQHGDITHLAPQQGLQGRIAI